MTKNEKLKQIREAVDIALEAQGLESTRALKMGYIVRKYGTRYIWIDMYTDQNNEHYCTYKEVNSDQIHKVRLGTTEVEAFEIIGRDIDLEDLMLTLDSTEKNNFNEKTDEIKYESDRIIHFDTGGDSYYEWGSAPWKPKVPLHLQDPSTIDFIHNLIVNNK